MFVRKTGHHLGESVTESQSVRRKLEDLFDGLLEARMHGSKVPEVIGEKLVKKFHCSGKAGGGQRPAESASSQGGHVGVLAVCYPKKQSNVLLRNISQ